MLLQTRGMSFAYRDEYPIISDLSLDLEEGQLLGVSGCSGAGKSTLLYLLGLLLTPTAGEIWVEGRCTAGMSDGERAEIRANEIGFLFQDSLLDQSRSVLENVIDGCVYRRTERSAEIARGLALISTLGVDVPATRRPGEVSGGQGQRIALCRALVGAPSVILADEPTGNLDQWSSALVQDVLRSETTRGTGVIIATHDAGLLKRCDKVICL